MSKDGPNAEYLATLNERITSNPADLASLMERGQIFLKQGDYARAIEDFSSVISKDKIMAEAYYERHICYLEQGRMADAVADINKAIDLEPKRQIFHHFKAYLYYISKDYEQAELLFKKALKIAANPLTAMRLGDTYFQQNKLQLAIEYYQLSLKIHPEALEPYVRLGDTYLALLEVEDALAMYNHVIKEDPDHFEGRMRRGDLYKQFAKYDEALVDLEHLLKIIPGQFEASMAMIEVLLAKEEYEQVATMLTTLKQEAAGHASAFLIHYFEGNLYFYTEQYKEAIIAFTQSLTMNPRDKQALLNRGNCFRALEAYEDAEEDYRAALKLDERYVNGYSNLGALYMQTDRFAEGIDTYKTLLQLRPDDFFATYNIALAYFHLQEWKISEKWFKRVKKMDGGKAAALYNIARISIKRDKLSYARKLLDEAIELHPEYAEKSKEDEILGILYE
ncbi:MAG: tetratricopeptide repeat protein [Candidatus Heimdallarchaeota archaeon]|nr:tetratricopeptide repeat protein [Candidatus Heimdallarchaeota archaeon]